MVAPRRRPLDQREGPRLPVPRCTVPVLGLIRLAPLCYGALASSRFFAGARRWLGRYGGAVAVGLFCSMGAAAVRLARLHAYIHRRLAHRCRVRALLWSALATDAQHDGARPLGCSASSPSRPLYSPATPTSSCWPRGRGGTGPRGGGRGLPPERRSGGPVRLLFGAGVADSTRWLRRPAAVPGTGLARSVSVSAQSCQPPADALAPDRGHADAGDRVRRADRHRRALGTSGRSGALRPRESMANSRSRRVRPRAAPGRSDRPVTWRLLAERWGLYAAYDWTAAPGLSTLQSVRFYLPAIGPIALLGAWTLTRLPLRKGLAVATAIAVVAMFGLGIWSFSGTTTSHLGTRPAPPDTRSQVATGPAAHPGRHASA